MAIQLATSTRNARLDAIETDTGVSAKLQIYTGSMPANCAAATTGTLLAEFNMASDWAAAASGGTKALSSLPLTDAANATGTAGYFRLFKTDGTTCQMQGTVTATGGGGDMTLDNTSITSGQTVNVTGFTITDANA
jgi:hypothetical protein